MFQPLREIGDGPETNGGMGKFGTDRYLLQELFISLPCIVIEIEVGQGGVRFGRRESQLVEMQSGTRDAEPVGR